MLFDDLIDWEKELLEGLAGYAPPQVNVLRKMFSHDKWVLASAVQKAIRRGNVSEALQAGYVLNQIDPKKLWSRLGILALEDIGSANPILAGQVLWVSGKAKWQESHGGEHKILSYLIERLCSSKKSRLANDLLCLANFGGRYQYDCIAYADYSVRQLEDAFLSDNYTLPQKAILAAYIAGTNYLTSYHLENRKGSPKLLFDLYMHSGCPEFLIDVMRMGLNRGEGHALTLGLSWLSLNKASRVSFIDQAPNPSPKINNLSPEAYDCHTRIGQQAYSLFLKRNPEIKSLIEKNFAGKNPTKITGWIVFGLEGQLMNNRISYKQENTLTNIAIEAYVDPIYTGDMREELEGIFSNKMDDIYECRKSVQLENALKWYDLV